MGKLLTTKHILNSINIHITTYIIILLSFLAGYFEITFLTILTIIIHELGHFITALFLNLKVKEIKIFMFGGVTVLNENLSVPIKKEIITLIMGPITQIAFLFLIYTLYKNGYVSGLTYTKLYKINILLLSFNLLPILPLDGGKLVNNILDLIFSYNISHKISIIISIITIPITLLYDKKLFILVITLFLIVNNIEEIKNHKYKINKLIIERKLNYQKYKKTKKIKTLKNIKRNENFTIKINGLDVEEKDYFKYYY
jgi:stage IV sporulation protein FB